MGTPMAPAAANLFMGLLETKILDFYPDTIQREFWKRFIDDIFLLWTDSLENLTSFLDFINSIHPTIKFTSSVSYGSIPFLDINIKLQDGYLTTDLYCKPTDSHAYLHSSSCHPRHVIDNMPYSQFLRLRRLCSKHDTFVKRCNEMEEWFLKRGHKKTTVRQARKKAVNIPRLQALTYNKSNVLSRTPFIITHHPANPPLKKWLADNHKNILHVSERMKKAVPEVPIVGERNCKSLKNILMPAQLPFAKDCEPGCFNCNKKCILCDKHLIQTQTFQSSQTKEVFTIRHRLTCETTNVIYLLFCDKCDHCQYVGETQNKLKTRFYLHRSQIKQNAGTLVTKHFNSPGHSLENMKAIAIEKVFSECLEARLKRENFWKKKLKTLTPFGLNTLD